MTKQERREYIRTAKQLGYSEEVITKISNAKDEYECSKILCTARHKKQRQGS